MKMYFMQLLAFAFAILGLSTPAFAQMYGTGMGAVQMSCPYGQTMGDEAQSIQDDISEQQQLLRELQAELRETKADKKEAERKMAAARRSMERQGIQEEYLTKLIDHITEMRSCTEYEGNRVPGGKQVRGTASVEAVVEEENTVSTTTVGNGKFGTEPYTNRQWADICDYTKSGRVRDAACSEAVVGPSLVPKPQFNPQACRSNLKAYQDAQEKLRKHENKIAALENQIQNSKDAIAAYKGDLREAQREYAREQREQMTEGGCVDCMLQGAGFVYQKPKTDWGGVAVNSILGIASMYLGNDLQKYVANQNARIGAQTPGAFPSFGYGFPFMMGAIGAATGGGGGMYGAVGGGVGNGAFGCANGMGGNGYGNMVGGAMGYPAGYYGSPYGGGAYSGMPMGMMMGGGIGMGMPVGSGYPMGMMAGGGSMMGYPMGGMAGGMMGMMAGGGAMMGGGYPMGAMMGGSMMGYPMGGMAGGMMGMMAGGGAMMGGGYPMGAMMGGSMMGYPMGGMAGGMMGMMAGGGAMMGGGYPMGAMMGGSMMGYPMGGMGGGMMGMMAGGGAMMGGGYPMGGMMGSMMGYPMGGMGGGMMGMMGMGMDSSAMMNAQMQMQQQQMQMYMQQQQMYMQAYQRAQENEMNKQRTLMGLQQELQGLIMRMQQVQYSSSTGGYLDYGSFYGGSSITGSPFSNGNNGGRPGSPFSNPGTGSVTPTGSAIPSTR